MADNALILTDSVPKIVITEPSPFPGTNPGLIENVLRALDDNEVISVTREVAEPVTVAPKADIVPEVNFPVTPDENVTSDSEASCSVSVEDKVEEVAMEVEDGCELLTPPANEVVAENGLGEVIEGVCASCCRRFDAFCESKFMIVILSVLLTMPLASAMMGSRYMDKCPLSSQTPIFLFMMGVLGVLVIVCRVLAIIQKTVTQLQCCDLALLKKIIVFGCMGILLLLCTEMTSFLRISPNFEPGAPNYCHRNFYNFTYFLNWTSLIVIAFLFVIHAPKCRRQNNFSNQS